MGTAPAVVFDTATLRNFAAIGRLDILEVRYGSRATWGESVYAEVEVAEGYEPGLLGLRGQAWIGPPLELFSAACLRDVDRIQRALSGPGEVPTKNLGEAESIHLIAHELDGNGVLAVDDNAARDLAEHRNIKTLRTHEILQECFAMDDLRCPEPFEIAAAMFDAGRHNVHVPADHTGIC